MEEEWIETKYKNYFINRDGQIKKKLKNGYKMCNTSLNKKTGYLNFSTGRVTGKVNVHRIMGETFLPNPHNLRNIDHIDRNKCNNKLENLRWFSQQDNMLNRDGIHGVGQCTDRNKWYAKTGTDIIGYFDTENEARACKYGYLKAKGIIFLEVVALMP
jgi:hypothetical protein